MRKPIEGTVARGMIAENHSFISGKNDDGTFIISNPLNYLLKFLIEDRKGITFTVVFATHRLVTERYCYSI